MLRVIRQICTKSLQQKLNAECLNINSFSSVFVYSKSVEPCYSFISQGSLQFCRHRMKKYPSKGQESESEASESDKDFFDDIQDKHTKTMKVDVTSMRLDVLLKVALGLSRNKLDTIFYDSKIRVNGEKVLKKSMHLQPGDEVDLIKGSSIDNKDFLTVARVEILSAVANEESISVKMRRCKSLTVDNYQGKHRWLE